MLKAFEEEKINIDYISGTSSGSIIAALFAMGYNSNEIYYLFNRYSKKIKYINYKNILKLIYGILVKRKIIIKGFNDGKIIEKIGTYNPMTEPSTIVLDKEKVEQWIKNGAKPTDSVKALIEKAK